MWEECTGKTYKAWDGRVYECVGYDPKQGLWMSTLPDGKAQRITCISERAIGRTFHEVRN